MNKSLFNIDLQTFSVPFCVHLFLFVSANPRAVSDTVGHRWTLYGHKNEVISFLYNKLKNCVRVSDWED